MAGSLHVCSITKVGETVEKAGARHLVTLLTAGSDFCRPTSIEPDNHLFLRMNDIVSDCEGLVSPGEKHVRALLDFAERWDCGTPLVINCFAGISRSTAAAYIIAAALAPKRNEVELARTLRRLSPSATPNRLLVTIADGLLARNGRMIAAIAGIGRGAEAFEGTPFVLDIGAPEAG